MRRALLLLSAIACSCGSPTDANHDGIADGVHSPDSVSLVAPSTPVGSISGQVLDMKFGPLDGVAVDVLIGGTASDDGTMFHVNSDGKGNFAVKGLPAGGFAQVTLSKSGYATARATTLVPAAAGNFPIDNGNGAVGTVLLSAQNDKWQLQLVTSGGQPVRNHPVTLEVNPSAVRYDDVSAGYGNPVGIYVDDKGQTNDMGVVSWMNLPNLAEEARIDGQLTVTVGAYTDMSTGVTYQGLRQQFSARQIFQGSAAKVLVLRTAAAGVGLSVIASNVDSMVAGTSDPLKSMIKTGPLWFVFNQPILPMSTEVKVTNETGLVTVPSTVMPVGSNIVQVNLTAPAPESGREYNVALRATSADNGTVFAGAGYFFGGDPMVPKPFAIEKVTYSRGTTGGPLNIQPGDQVVVILNQPVRSFGGAVEAFFDADLNNDGTRGNSQGELSPTGAMNPNTSGYPLTPYEPIAEPMSTFTNLPSFYTTRHVFTYFGTANVSNATKIVLAFSALPSTLSGYRTIWGIDVEADVSIAMISPP
jgi:hypothetical protein